MLLFAFAIRDQTYLTVSCSHGYYIQNLPKISVKVLKRALFVVVPLGIMLINIEVKATDSNLFPFDATPDGFETYLNNVKGWGGVDSIVFENPKECVQRESGVGMMSYLCTFDYTKYSALGQQTCIANRVWYTTPMPGYEGQWRRGPRILSEGECGKWEKVEELPLVGLSEKEVKEHDEYEQKTAKPNKSPVPGTSNLSTFAALLIASFSGAAILAVIQKVLNKSNKDKT